ncbi:sugar phosphate exchanger 3-like [Lethenteron reissneri]|uniref:sugar phosphate exchanger 3-like n=1 Tax=Lethenteron reissneri TaxID=7753 RepID=UPI002AB6A494|nr:sugar phosphate exchanger 3-like [Lethenteron reissneri]
MHAALTRHGYTQHHLCIFLLTFSSYALFNATRKTLSCVKVSFLSEWTRMPINDSTETLSPPEIWSAHSLFPDEEKASLFLGALDTIFLFTYALGSYISGFLSDRFNLRLVLSVGMWLSALVAFVFGSVTEWLGFYNMPFYAFLWALNGFVQSTGWPCTVAIMGNWFGNKSRGFIFGVWSSCGCIGNILGALLVSTVIGYGYEYTFLVMASLLFSGGIVVFFGMAVSPAEVGLPLASVEEEETSCREASVTWSKASESLPVVDMANQRTYGTPPDDGPREGSSIPTEKPALGFFKIVCLPGVAVYALAYACLKLVNYAFFFWLPYYLAYEFSWTQVDASRMSIWYDFGGIIGGAMAGLISDRLGKRAPVIALMLLLAVATLACYLNPFSNRVWNGFLLVVTGFFVSGTANLISSAVPADLGQQGTIQGNREALGTVTGIVDGTGSLGASVGQFIVAVIYSRFGWEWVFVFFIVMIFLTLIILLPLVVREIKNIFVNQQVGCLSTT